MECDEEELKATKEKSADEMFSELGYRKNEDKRVIIYDYIQYFNHFKTFKKIYFYKLDKGISLCNYNITEEMKIDYNLTMQELKAIYKKCEELKWI